MFTNGETLVKVEPSVDVQKYYGTFLLNGIPTDV